MPGETDIRTEGGAAVSGNGNTGGGNFVGRDKITLRQAPSREEVQNRRNLAILRQFVKHFWIDGVLTHSLYQEALIQLEMIDRSEAVDNQHWNMLLRTSSDTGQPLAPGT